MLQPRLAQRLAAAHLRPLLILKGDTQSPFNRPPKRSIFNAKTLEKGERKNVAAAAAVAGEPAAAAAAAGSPPNAAEVLQLVALLPPSVRQQLEQHPDLPLLLEVVLDLGR